MWVLQPFGITFSQFEKYPTANLGMTKENFSITTLLSRTDQYLFESILNNRFWKIKTVFLCCLITFIWLFVTNRGYIYENFRGFYADVILDKPQPFFFWNSIVKQGQAPLTPMFHESGSHEANRTFRLTIPLIAKFFGFNSLLLYLFQIVLGIATLYLLVHILYKVFGDKVLAFYTTFAFVNVYMGSSFFLNCFGHGDAYTFFFIICALLMRQQIFLSVFLQLAFWCDERSIITVAGILIFQYLYFKLSKKDLVSTSILILLNVVSYMLIRVYLSNNYNLVAEDVETFTFEKYFYFIKFVSLWYGKRSYLGLEGFSLLVLITFIIMYHDKQYLKIAFSIFYWLPIVIVSFLVGDTVRTLSFTFIFWMSALIFLKERLNQNQLKILILFISFINFLIPTSFP